jgi:LysR family glycine cleavage system transcriptional activator
MQSNRYPVISPQLRARENIRNPEDLLRVRLMYDETDDAWTEWFEAAGMSPSKMPSGPVFPNCELATTAVEQGQGVSLAYDAMVRSTLEAGRVERLFETVTIPFVIYSVAYQQERAGDPMIRAFRDWISDEVARDRTGVSQAAAAE